MRLSTVDERDERSLGIWDLEGRTHGSKFDELRLAKELIALEDIDNLMYGEDQQIKGD